jgi:hypothetical protein
LSWRNSIGCASEEFASGTRASQAAQSVALRKAGLIALFVAGRLKFMAHLPAVGASVEGAFLTVGPDFEFAKSGVWLTDVSITISW